VTHGIRAAADLTDGAQAGPLAPFLCIPAKINWLPMKPAGADEAIR
jgi:hypothetical protein